MSDNDTYNYTTTGNVKPLPEDASPTDVMDTEEGWRISTHLPMSNTEQEEESEKAGTFIMEYLMKQDKHISQYYTEMNFLTVPIEIYELIKSTKRIQIATDGGAIPLKGSLEFVFAD
jgi:hypothetical protein